jgi:hypothetical protein
MRRLDILLTRLGSSRRLSKGRFIESAVLRAMAACESEPESDSVDELGTRTPEATLAVAGGSPDPVPTS